MLATVLLENIKWKSEIHVWL